MTPQFYTFTQIYKNNGEKTRLKTCFEMVPRMAKKIIKITSLFFRNDLVFREIQSIFHQAIKIVIKRTFAVYIRLA